MVMGTETVVPAQEPINGVILYVTIAGLDPLFISVLVIILVVIGVF